MTTELSAAQRGRLAWSLVPVAMDLAAIVHGEGDVESVAELLADLSEAERHALPVVLAGMVDVDRTPQELLGWITFDEFERPLPANAVMVLPARRYLPEAPERPLVPCGTPRAYSRHRERGEEPCGPCREANAEYRREWRRKQKQREDVA